MFVKIICFIYIYFSVSLLYVCHGRTYKCMIKSYTNENPPVFFFFINKHEIWGNRIRVRFFSFLFLSDKCIFFFLMLMSLNKGLHLYKYIFLVYNREQMTHVDIWFVNGDFVDLVLNDCNGVRIFWRLSLNWNWMSHKYTHIHVFSEYIKVIIKSGKKI